MTDIRSIVEGYNTEISLVVLLLRIRLGTASEQELDAFLSAYLPNPDKFLELVNAHQVESLVYGAEGFSRLFPGNEKFEDFKKRVDFRARLNMVLLDEMISLQKIFRINHKEVVFYKGVPLSKLLFNDFTSRATTDIDILIHAKDFESIRNILLEAEFEEVYFYPVKYPEYFLRINRESTFRKKTIQGRYIYIEIQWAPLPPMFSLPYNNDYFFSCKESMKLMGEELNVPCIEKHLIILFVHHGIADLWRNLKHLFDIALLCKKYESSIRWDEVSAYIQKGGFTRNAKTGIDAIYLLLGVRIPLFSSKHIDHQTIDLTLKSLMQYPLLEKRKKSISNISRQLLLSESPGQKLSLITGYLRTFFMPSMIDLENHEFPPALFPLYYISKRFRFLFKNKNNRSF